MWEAWKRREGKKIEEEKIDGKEKRRNKREGEQKKGEYSIR